MNSVKRKVWKLTKWFVIIAVVLALSGFLWIKGLYKDYVTEDSFEQYVSLASSSSELPNMFYETLEAVYPRIFETSLNDHVFREGIVGKPYSPCPCTDYALRSPLYLDGPTIKRILSRASLTWAYESVLTQKQCFNVVMADYDFMNQVHGIEDAARIYYGKELENLTLDERLELIVMMRNSAVYNKFKRQDMLTERVEELKRIMEN